MVPKNRHCNPFKPDGFSFPFHTISISEKISFCHPFNKKRWVCPAIIRKIKLKVLNCIKKAFQVFPELSNTSGHEVSASHMFVHNEI